MNNMFRTALAVATAVVVAGPALVLANIPQAPAYLASSTVLQGPATVNEGATAAYNLRVTFTNGDVLTYTGSPATFSASQGSFAGNVFTAPSVSTNTFVVVAGQLNPSVRATRLVRVNNL